jgi:hypothetical protein
MRLFTAAAKKIKSTQYQLVRGEMISSAIGRQPNLALGQGREISFKCIGAFTYSQYVPHQENTI